MNVLTRSGVLVLAVVLPLMACQFKQREAAETTEPQPGEELAVQPTAPADEAAPPEVAPPEAPVAPEAGAPQTP